MAFGAVYDQGISIALASIIGSGKGGPWSLLNFKALHRNSIFAIEKSSIFLSGPPQLSVPSSAGGIYGISPSYHKPVKSQARISLLLTH